MKCNVIWSMVGMVLAGALATQAEAASVLVDNANFTGSRTTSSGLTAGGIWGVNGMRIDWTITFNGGTNLYTYNYWLSDDSAKNSPIVKGDVSHFLLEVSPTFTTANVKPGGNSTNAPTTYTSTGSVGSEPEMPAGGVFAIKFNFGNSNPNYTLVSDRAPIWGDFYAKDGKDKDYGNNVLWNIGFGTDPLAGATHFTNWIPTPDTVTAVPVPAAGWMGIATLAAMGLSRLTTRRRHPQA